MPSHTSIHVTIGLSDKLSQQVDKLLGVLGGQLSAEDQAALNGLLARESARAAKLEALDAKTP